MKTNASDASALNYPVQGRAFLAPGKADRLPLNYLGWGTRFFGAFPVTPVEHPGWTIVVIETGSPTLLRENACDELKAGDVALLGPRCAYGWKDRRKRACKFLLWMWETLLLEPFRDLPPTAFERWHLAEESHERLSQLHKWCREDVGWSDQATLPLLQATQRATEAVLLREHSGDRREDRDRRRLELAQRWLDTHLDTRQPCARLADYLDISPASTHRLFKKWLKCSPQEYHQRARMIWAEKQLQRGSGSVKTLAYRLGFRHPNDFSRAFRRHFNASPSATLRKAGDETGR